MSQTITVESRSVAKEPGSEVVAGTVNQDGSLRIRITKTGEETTLAGIMRLVDEAQQSKSRTQLLADRAAGWLFYVALAVAGITAVAWIVAVGFNIGVLERVVTVLVIACPHALGLAVPLVVAINTSTAAQNGMLIRDRIAMEESRNLDTVMFDKTGTLTKGEQGVVGVETAGDWSEERVFEIAAGVEGDSEHMIARAIRDAAEEREVQRASVSNFENRGAVIAGSWMTAVLVLLGIAWFLLAPLSEEPWLRDQYGEAYEAYRESVPRFFGRPSQRPVQHEHTNPSRRDDS